MSICYKNLKQYDSQKALRNSHIENKLSDFGKISCGVPNALLPNSLFFYGWTSDTLGGYNKRTKGDSILMTFFYYKLHMELSKNNKHEELILR